MNQPRPKNQQPQPPNCQASNPTRTGLYVALGVILLAAYVLLDQLYFTPKIAYVDTSKLMVGFSEAAEVERELNAGDKKWREQLKELECQHRFNISHFLRQNISHFRKKLCLLAGYQPEFHSILQAV